MTFPSCCNKNLLKLLCFFLYLSFTSHLLVTSLLHHSANVAVYFPSVKNGKAQRLSAPLLTRFYGPIHNTLGVGGEMGPDTGQQPETKEFWVGGRTVSELSNSICWDVLQHARKKLVTINPTGGKFHMLRNISQAGFFFLKSPCGGALRNFLAKNQSRPRVGNGWLETTAINHFKTPYLKSLPPVYSLPLPPKSRFPPSFFRFFSAPKRRALWAEEEATRVMRAPLAGRRKVAKKQPQYGRAYLSFCLLISLVLINKKG